MDVRLDDIELVKRVDDPAQATAKDLRTVTRVRSQYERRFVEHRVACVAGSIFQDSGRQPIRILFEGEFLGEDARDNLTLLKSKYEGGEPVSFTSDISTLAQVEKVLIEEFHAYEIAGSPNQFRYRMVLSECKEPPPEEEEPSSQDGEAVEEVEKESEIDDIRGQVLDSEGNPSKDVTVKISGPSGELQAKTDEQGYYELLDVPEGKYEITVDAEGYEDVKVEVEVKKGGGET